MADDSPGDNTKGPTDTAEVFALKKAVFAKDMNEVAELLLRHEYSAEMRTFAFDSVCEETTSFHYSSKFYFWRRLSAALEKSAITEIQRLWIVKEACSRADDFSVSKYILPHCPTTQSETVLSYFVSRGLWMSVGQLLERGVSDTQRRYAIKQAADRADNDNFSQYILPHCDDEELDSLFPQLASRGLWGYVGICLKNGVSATQRRHALEQAANCASDNLFIHFILPHCSDEELDSVSPQLASRGLWESLGKMMERELCSDSDTEDSDDTSERAFNLCVVLYCTDTKRVSVFAVYISHGMWQCKGKVWFTCDIDIPTLNVYVQEPGEPILVLLPYGSDYVFQIELSQLVAQQPHTQGTEETVINRQRGPIIITRQMYADNQSLTNTILSCILPKCRDDELKSMFTWLVDGGWWEYVGKVLHADISDTQRRHAVEQAAERASDWCLARYIVPHCSEEELESVLPQLVSRGL
jgi:hypothetical protein